MVGKAGSLFALCVLGLLMIADGVAASPVDEVTRIVDCILGQGPCLSCPLDAVSSDVNVDMIERLVPDEPLIIDGWTCDDF